MRVLAFASQKGGSGKTTLSAHMAVQAERAGAGPVVLVDTDPQGSLSEWWNDREPEMPAFAQTTTGRLLGDLDDLRARGFKLAIIDTPPAITMAIQAVVVVSDMVVIPTRPSPHDLRAAGATVDLVENADKSLMFVINAASARAKITSDAAIALSQHGTVAPTIVHNRTVFASSMIDGRTVMEVDASSNSSKEIEGLWEYMDARLDRQVRRRLFQAQSTHLRQVAGPTSFGRRQHVAPVSNEDEPTEASGGA